jgi:hypothetical protein
VLTNRFNLPAPLVNAIRNDSYTSGGSDITVTGLIRPAQMRRLLQGREVTEDASDVIWRLLGQAVHAILERAYPDAALTEKRVYATVNGWRVSGQFDVYDNGVLTDYKITSVYSRNGKDEWTQQLNLLAALCRLNDLPVQRVEIVAIFRDWRPREAQFGGDRDYPESQVAVIPVELWDAWEAEAFLSSRVSEHQQEDPPPCTDEERWFQPGKWALMQKGRKRAIKLFPEKPEIILSKDQYWEERPGRYARCEGYCNASPYCPQWAEYEATRDKRTQDVGAEPADVEDPARLLGADSVAGERTYDLHESGGLEGCDNSRLQAGDPGSPGA